MFNNVKTAVSNTTANLPVLKARKARLEQIKDSEIRTLAHRLVMRNTEKGMYNGSCGEAKAQADFDLYVNICKNWK